MLINPEADQQEIERVIKDLGLDRPVSEQYWFFLVNAFQGDLGKSFVFGEPALKLIVQRMPATFELAIFSLMLAVIFGIPLGIYAGIKPNSKVSKTIMAGSILGFSMPTFWVGIILIMFFLYTLGGYHLLVAEKLVISWGFQAQFLLWMDYPIFFYQRLTWLCLNYLLSFDWRAGTREIILQDYIKFARAKGLTEERIIKVHLLKNILIPIVTVIGLEFGSLIAFSTVTETVFAWPGMGKLIIEAIYNLDRPIVVAYLMIIVLIFVTLNLIVDILYSVLDPRVRIKGAGS